MHQPKISKGLVINVWHILTVITCLSLLTVVMACWWCAFLINQDAADRKSNNIHWQVVPDGELPDNLYYEAGDEFDSLENEHVFGALPSRDEWLGKFNAAKREKLKTHPLCQGCGRTPEECGHKTHDAHHKISVKRIKTEKDAHGKRKFHDALQWDEENLEILYRPTTESRLHAEDHGCHFIYGHGSISWSESNPNVEHDANKHFKELYPQTAYRELVNAYRATQNAPSEIVKPRKHSPSKSTVSP